MGRVSGELVKKGGASSEWAGWQEPAGASRQEQKTTIRWGCTNCPATHPFIDPVMRGGSDDPKRCVVNRIRRSGWAPASTRPSREGRKRLHFTSGKMIPSCGIVPLRTPRHELLCTESPGRAPATGRQHRSMRCLSVSHAARAVQRVSAWLQPR